MSEKKKIEDLESKMDALESIVAELEDENTTLGQGIELFEKGIALTRECFTELSRGKGRITELKRKMDELTEVPLGEEEA